MNTGQWAVIGIAIILWVWFWVGYSINRKKGEVAFHWLADGLEEFGERVQIGRAGRLVSGVKLVIPQAKDPFKGVEVFILLEPRENLPFWIFRRLQGRRDEVFIRAELKKAPQQELVVARSRERAFRRLVARETHKPFELIRAGAGFEIARRGRLDARALDSTKQLLTSYGEALLRFSLEYKPPHVTVTARLAPLQNEPAKLFFNAIRNIMASGIAAEE